MFTKAIESVSTVSGWLSGAGVYAMVFIVFIDVVLRYFIGKPLLFADEVSVYCMIYITFIGAALTMKRGAHIKVDILYSKLRKNARLWLDAVTLAVGTIIGAIATWQTALWVRYTYNFGFTSPGILETPMWIPMAIIPIGLFLWTLQYLVEAIKALNTLIQEKS